MINTYLLLYPLHMLAVGVQLIVQNYSDNLGIATPSYISHPLLLFIVLTMGPVSINLLGAFMTTTEIIHLITTPYGTELLS